MISVHLFLLAVYLVYLLVFLFLILRVKSACVGYSLKTHAISALGLKTSPRCRLFNNSVIVFGFATILFGSILRIYLERSIFVNLVTGSLLISSIFTILAGVFPYDIQPIKHNVAAFALFVFAMVTSTLLIYPLLLATWLPDYFVVLNALFVLAAGTLICGFLIKHFKGRWIKNIWAWEWMAFILIYAHNLVLCVFLIVYLLKLQ